MGLSRRINAALVIPVFAAALVVSACETKEQQGTVAGAVVGGAVGSLFGSGSGRVVAIGAGALAGGFIGNRIGKNMDDTDRLKAQQAAQRAQTAPVGSNVQWSNPDSGNNGNYYVAQEGFDSSGNRCRQFEHTVNAGGQTEVTKGVVCQRADGQWVTVDYKG